MSSAFTSAGSTVVAVGILSQFDVDKFGNQVFGLDPIVFMGLITVAAGAFGWLAGPSLGNVVFSLVYRRHKRQLAVVRNTPPIIPYGVTHAPTSSPWLGIIGARATADPCLFNRRKKGLSTIESSAIESIRQLSP